MAPNVIELRLVKSTNANQPYFVQAWDVGVRPERQLAFSETYVSKAGARNMAEALIKGDVVYEVFKAVDGRWYWHVQSRNGEILVRSAYSFASSAPAQTDADRLESNAADAVIVDAAS